jgi:hypothetical protein
VATTIAQAWAVLATWHIRSQITTGFSDGYTK